jgi:hypothetical protein
MTAIHHAARIAFGAAAAFLLLLALLHVLKPEMDPSWHMISEYALGRHGWVMRLALISLATSCVALFILWREGFVAGGVLLAIAGIGMLGLALFATDPITTPRETITLARLAACSVRYDFRHWFSGGRDHYWLECCRRSDVRTAAALAAVVVVDRLDRIYHFRWRRLCFRRTRSQVRA